MSRRAETRKFHPPVYYGANGSSYHLLPFRFHALSDEREVLVNEVGDYLICPRGTADKVAQRGLAPDDPLLADLVAGFFISEQPLPALIDVLATRYRTKKAFLDSFTSLHIIVVTLRCNHTCHYCQVSRQTADREEFDISLAHLDRSLDLVFKSPAAEITIEFQGGEPCLAFDRVRHAVQRALDLNRVYGKGLTFVLCTNLTLVTDEILDFCKEYEIRISTSLDGPAFLHDDNRRLARASSYAELQTGLARTRRLLGRELVSALMTTSRRSLDYPIEIVDAYRENGFDRIFLRAASPYGFATRHPTLNWYEASDFTRFYKTALSYILELNKSGERFIEDYAAIILTKVLTSFAEGFVDLQSPAGLVNSVVVYNYDGGVYASDESRMLAEIGDNSFKLGTVEDAYQELFFGTVAQRISASWSNEALAGCSECGFQTYCGADPVRAHVEQGDPEGYRPTSRFCGKNMEIFEFLFNLLDTDPEAEAVFRSWVA